MENKIITFPGGQSAAIFLLSTVLLQSTFWQENRFSSSCNLENLSMTNESHLFHLCHPRKGLSQCHGCQCNAQEHVSVMRCVSFSTNAPVFLPRCCQDVSTVSPLSVVSCSGPPGTSNFPSVHSSPLTRPHHTYLTNTKQISNTFQSF